MKSYGSYEAFLLADSKGNCVASSWPALVATDLSANPAFKGAKDGKLSVREFERSPIVEQIDPDSKGWTLAISAPVKVGTNVIGVLIGYVKWSAVEQLVGGIPVGQYRVCLRVWTRISKVVFHPDKGISMVRLPSSGSAGCGGRRFQGAGSFARYELQESRHRQDGTINLLG